MPSPLWVILIVLQVFHLLFLLLHDWVPIGNLNDVAAFQQSFTLPQKILSLLVPSIPVVFGLAFTLLGAAHPRALSFRVTLSAVYGFLFLGELEAWWMPYAFGASPERVARYQALFGHTHAFLPRRRGVVPNSLHVALHAATVATLALIWTV